MEPRFYDRRSNDIPDLTIIFCVPAKVIYKSGVRLQRYPDLTIWFCWTLLRLLNPSSIDRIPKKKKKTKRIDSWFLIKILKAHDLHHSFRIPTIITVSILRNLFISPEYVQLNLPQVQLKLRYKSGS